jgi:hypothetical protein
MRLSKYLLLLVIMIKSSFAGQSAIITKNTTDTLRNPLDTICKPTEELKAVYSDALRYRYADSLLKITESQLAEKKAQAEILEERGLEITDNHRREISNLEGQVATLKDQLDVFEKMWKREKRKRRLSQGVGVLTTLAAIILPLIIKK